MRQALSFGEDDDEDLLLKTDERSQPKKRITKNPDVDTSFLPGLLFYYNGLLLDSSYIHSEFFISCHFAFLDRERDETVAKQRKELEIEWLQEQEKIKNEVQNLFH